MLTLVTPEIELFDSNKNMFVGSVKSQTLQLEHSLVSISKWESTWCKPFLASADKTNEEALHYIECMTLTQNVDKNTFKYMPDELIDKVTAYINHPMTATTIKKEEGRTGSREIVTSEIIYYWMISLQIPLECQKWHLNRLLTLINVCNLKNQPPKKMSKQEIYRRNKELNAARKRNLGSPG